MVENQRNLCRFPYLDNTIFNHLKLIIFGSFDSPDFYEKNKSFAKLSCPIVACELGRFYKKEAVIELLLDRNQLTGRFSPEIHETCFHIRNMKDVTVSQ